MCALPERPTGPPPLPSDSRRPSSLYLSGLENFSVSNTNTNTGPYWQQESEPYRALRDYQVSSSGGRDSRSYFGCQQQQQRSMTPSTTTPIGSTRSPGTVTSLSPSQSGVISNSNGIHQCHHSHYIPYNRQGQTRGSAVADLLRSPTYQKIFRHISEEFEEKGPAALCWKEFKKLLDRSSNSKDSNSTTEGGVTTSTQEERKTSDGSRRASAKIRDSKSTDSLVGLSTNPGGLNTTTNTTTNTNTNSRDLDLASELKELVEKVNREIALSSQAFESVGETDQDKLESFSKSLREFYQVGEFAASTRGKYKHNMSSLNTNTSKPRNPGPPPHYHNSIPYNIDESAYSGGGSQYPSAHPSPNMHPAEVGTHGPAGHGGGSTLPYGHFALSDREGMMQSSPPAHYHTLPPGHAPHGHYHSDVGVVPLRDSRVYQRDPQSCYHQQLYYEAVTSRDHRDHRDLGLSSEGRTSKTDRDIIGGHLMHSQMNQMCHGADRDRGQGQMTAHYDNYHSVTGRHSKISDSHTNNFYHQTHGHPVHSGRSSKTVTSISNQQVPINHSTPISRPRNHQPPRERPPMTMADFLGAELLRKSGEKCLEQAQSQQSSLNRDRENQMNSNQFNHAGANSYTISQSWLCPRCTFQNAKEDVGCQACGTDRSAVRLMEEFPPLK